MFCNFHDSCVFFCKFGTQLNDYLNNFLCSLYRISPDVLVCCFKNDADSFISAVISKHVFIVCYISISFSHCFSRLKRPGKELHKAKDHPCIPARLALKAKLEMYSVGKSCCLWSDFALNRQMMAFRILFSFLRRITLAY